MREARIGYLILVAAFLISVPPSMAAVVSRSTTPLDKVVLKGELGVRFQAATANLLARQDRYSLDSFRSNASSVPGAALWPDWPGDQLGRMFSVMHAAEGYGWTPAAVLRRAVGDAVLPFQTSAGSFGLEKPADPMDSRIVSGNAFALRGLMDAFEDSRDARYLESARRLARYYESIFDSWKSRRDGLMHEFYGHCLDGLVRLYELGGDRWALDLARKIGERTGRTPHTHHSLSMYRGVIDLYRATGDTRFLDRAEDYLQWCRENQLVTGGLPESMPSSEQDEGCALADFIVVNLMMFQATGRDRYLEDAEHMLVNHFFMNQFHTGGFGHRGYAPDIVGGKGWQGWEGRFGSENPGCCSLWGQWALGLTGAFIVTREGRAVDVNFYPCAAIGLPDLSASLEIESDFPRLRRAAVTIHCDQPAAFAVRLRIPAWAEEPTLTLNGEKAQFPLVEKRVVIEREWRSGDRLDIAFGGSLRLVSWPKANAATAAVFDGPFCLALSSAETDVDAFRAILVTSGGKLALTVEGKPQAVDGKGNIVSVFRPIAEEWLSPELKNPHRLRVLFTPRTR